MVLVVILAVFVGLSLGLLGGGGSTLAVPLFLFAARLPEKAAILASLVVVSITSAVAAVGHLRAGQLDWRSGLRFAPLAMLGAYLGGRVAEFVPGPVLIGLFSLMMLATAVAMWRGPTSEAPANRRGSGSWLVVPVGISVGFLTGLVGAGGGFLVVPALTLLLGLPMRRAIGTSLFVIAANSTSALVGYASHAVIDLRLVGAAALAACLGAVLGAHGASRLRTELLRRGFAVLVLVMGSTLLISALGPVFT